MMTINEVQNTQGFPSKGIYKRGKKREYKNDEYFEMVSWNTFLKKNYITSREREETHI